MFDDQKYTWTHVSYGVTIWITQELLDDWQYMGRLLYSFPEIAPTKEEIKNPDRSGH